MSGLKINLEKSFIVGINTNQKMVSQLASILDCQETEWPLSYMGLPLGGNPNSIGFWDLVVEKVARRLDGWKKAWLSFGEEITLIQSYSSYIPSHFLSLFRIPGLVAKTLEKLQRNFLWSRKGVGKKDHLLSWRLYVDQRSKEV